MQKNARTFVSHEFSAVCGQNSRMLLFNSISSPLFREVGFYYGHPQSRFWKVLVQVLGEPTKTSLQEKRIYFNLTCNEYGC